jgi:hypothetical protein
VTPAARQYPVMVNVPDVGPRRRLSGAEREAASRALLARYESGRSIRELCAETGYSIGRVRKLLEEAGVTYRGRGGAVRRAPADREAGAAGGHEEQEDPARGDP